MNLYLINGQRFSEVENPDQKAAELMNLPTGVFVEWVEITTAKDFPNRVFAVGALVFTAEPRNPPPPPDSWIFA